jgi:hypothetical protein
MVSTGPSGPANHLPLLLHLSDIHPSTFYPDCWKTDVALITCYHLQTSTPFDREDLFMLHLLCMLVCASDHMVIFSACRAELGKER